jgi:two-component system, cell cycle sensor histidine kinase and response regulator CckA
MKESGAVLADPTQIQQVVMNLCTNAAYAMEKKGGTLEVSIEDTELGPEHLHGTPDLKAGAYVRISISDTGQGIPTQILEHIFDPYYTTKEKGVGTGLGLAVVHGIIKRLHGGISVESQLGKGTLFKVFLPKIDLKVSEKAEPLSLPPTGRERILVVDDEEMIISMEQEILKRLGYSVISKTNPIEALEVFRNKAEEFDLVITDQTMPYMTGEHLAQKLIEIRPDIPIVLCTGYSTLIDEASAKALGIREFVMKPIVLLDLARIIRKVLDNK